MKMKMPQARRRLQRKALQSRLRKQILNRRSKVKINVLKLTQNLMRKLKLRMNNAKKKLRNLLKRRRSKACSCSRRSQKVRRGSLLF